MEVLYGLACSTEVAYYTYIYAKVDRAQYKVVTSYTYTAILIGNFAAAVVSQALVSSELMNYHQLNYLTLGFVSAALLISIFLPGVDKSIYFYRNINSEPLQPSLRGGECGGEGGGCDTGEDAVLNLRGSNIVRDNVSLTCGQRLRRAYGMLWLDFKRAYSNPYVVKWSVWWAIASAGFVQVGNQSFWNCNSH